MRLRDIIILLILTVVLASAKAEAREPVKNLSQDPEYVELCRQFEKLQYQMVEAEKEAKRAYDHYLENTRRGRKYDLSKDPAYKKAQEKRERKFIELSKIMEKMTQKAREASGLTEHPSDTVKMPILPPGPETHVYTKEPEINLTYPAVKSLENQPKTE